MKYMKNLWLSLDTRKQIIVVIASLAVVLTLFAIFQIARKPSMSLLYSGLEARAAGDVMQALESKAIPYEIRGDSIFVELASRDALRMSLAGEGLPGITNTGYEVLDGLNGFGTTSQMFDAAYWRAKEGELARTITSSPVIASARVHIATAFGKSSFRDTQPSASVSVTTATGTLSSSHAKALKYLVASAVAGLSPENVAIVDGQGGLIDAFDNLDASSIADKRADILRGRVQNLLEARVGRGNAVVEISVETVNESESIHQRNIDPESRIVISTDAEEIVNSSSNAGSDAVGVASNLPDGDASSEKKNSSKENRTRERVNYEVSETERRITREPGGIKRLTVAVLVNSSVEAASDAGSDIGQRSEVELENLKELVASAVGYDQQRGDIITIKSMQFQGVEEFGSTSNPSFVDKLNLEIMSLLKLGILTLVILFLSVFVLRPILKSASKSSNLPIAALGGNPGNNGEMSGGELTALTGEIDDNPLESHPMEMALSNHFQFDETKSAPLEDPVERLRALIEERKDETVEILRTWLEPKEEEA